jgi:hypothetical protein
MKTSRRKPNSIVNIMTLPGRTGTLRDAWREIDALKAEVALLKDANKRLADNADFDNRVPEETPLPKPKRGPAPKHSEGLYQRRDELAGLLETYWPEIEPTCYPKVNPKELRTILRKIEEFQGGSVRDIFTLLLQNFPTLIAFLESDRFRGNPLQIANAMAGVPQIGWWRSLKLCQKKRDTYMGIGQRAVKAYVRRKHRRLYNNLELKPDDPIHFMLCMRNSRTREKNMLVYKKYPHQLLAAWESAKPLKELM